MLLIGNCVLSNLDILILQIILICGFTLTSVRMGERVLNSWLCLLAVAMNLLVMKQITLFGLEVTATDALAVSYMLGLNLLQEYFGRSAARQHACMAVFICAGFTLLTVLHNFYVPNEYDTTHTAYLTILNAMPRVCMASTLTFFMVQLMDISFFQFIRRKFRGRFLTVRIFICVGLAQFVDTGLFTFLGLYGIVENIWHIMGVSVLFKFIVLIGSVPFVSVCKKWIPNKNDDPFYKLSILASLKS